MGRRHCHWAQRHQAPSSPFPTASPQSVPTMTLGRSCTPMFEWLPCMPPLPTHTHAPGCCAGPSCRSGRPPDRAPRPVARGRKPAGIAGGAARLASEHGEGWVRQLSVGRDTKGRTRVQGSAQSLGLAGMCQAPSRGGGPMPHARLWAHLDRRLRRLQPLDHLVQLLAHAVNRRGMLVQDLCG